ncbi:MAG: hypothetical protein QXJ75_00125 [Candidatus Bathyarchaeia archaeon]
MKVTPIAFDSLGTRSMCTLVETKDTRLLIDPGAALGPMRYGLPPHELEWDRLASHWRQIVELARSTQVLIVTHYHYDHYNPDDHVEVYGGKIVLVKHPTEKINNSQKVRAAYFLGQLKKFPPAKLAYCDGCDFTFGRTLIRFSQPVFHGTSSRLGYVVEVLVDEGGVKFIHSSDVEGPSQKDQVRFILQNKPDLLILDGPMSYMAGYRYSFEDLEASVENMVKIVKVCPLETLVVDHHMLRDLNWRERVEKVFKVGAERGVKVVTAAEYIGITPDMLEARRSELYRRDPWRKTCDSP